MFSVSMQEDKTLFGLSHSKISKPCLILIFSTVGVEESCVETYRARNMTWNDAPCTGLKKYICELVPESVMDTVVVG